MGFAKSLVLTLLMATALLLVTIRSVELGPTQRIIVQARQAKDARAHQVGPLRLRLELRHSCCNPVLALNPDHF